MARRSFTFYLAKDELDDFSEYLTDNARSNLRLSSTQRVTIKDFAKRSELIIFRGHVGAPKWLKSLAQNFSGVRTFETTSGAAVLFFEIMGRVLVVTFSFGWMYLDEDKFASDFGLKVAVNGLDEAKLRRLERTNLGDALKGVSQSAFQREFRSFGLEDALDLVRKVSGVTKEDLDADSMVGSRSLKLTGDFSYSDIPRLAEDLVGLYDSNDYKNTQFKIIDSVKPIGDGSKIRELNAIAAERIREELDSFELGLPSTVDAEGIAFKFHGPGLRNSHADLLLRHYVAALRARGRLASLDADTLEAHKIEAILDDDRPSLVWKIRKALIGSVDIGSERFAINEGAWFQIEDAFRQSVEDHYFRIVHDWVDDTPIPIRTIYDDNGNGRLEREEVYNERLAAQYGFGLLDKEEISVAGASRSGFEPCDLIDLHGRRFIHVKKSSRTSSILSHFFKQGSNSARQFKRIPDSWMQLVERLESTGQTSHAEQLREILSEAGTDKWAIEYWIIDAPRANGSFNIPFFSKISLRDEALDMYAMEYDVRLRYIRKEPEAVSRFEP